MTAILRFFEFRWRIAESRGLTPITFKLSSIIPRFGGLSMVLVLISSLVFLGFPRLLIKI